MRTIRTLFAGLAIALASGPAGAQHALEVISLRHSTAEQVLPALRPLLEPGGTLTGRYGELIVRTSPRNLAELRRALDALDRPRRRLQILVRFDDSIAASRERMETHGSVGSRGGRVGVRIESTASVSEERIDQRVQVLEGGRAWIAAGQARPIRQRQRIRTPAGVISQDTFVVHDATTGFEVVARTSGERVFLDIGAERRRFVDGTPGTTEAQRVSSTVSARMGEWVEIAQRIWIKVEEIRN